MGYVYSRAGLVCGGCGTDVGVRKRVCPHKVRSSRLHGGGTLPCCPPPALCPACYRASGGQQGVHAQCRARAAESQAEEDAQDAALDAGESFTVAAFGYGDRGVPTGMVGVLFRDKDRRETGRMVTAEAYAAAHKASKAPALSMFPGAPAWALPREYVAS